MDYFSFNARRRGSSATTQDHLNGPPQAERRPMPGAPSLESLRAPSTIRIRRLPSSLNTQQTRPTTQSGNEAVTPGADSETAGRRRSFSAPQRYTGEVPAQNTAELSRQRTLDNTHMPAITEGVAASSLGANRSAEPREAEETPQPVTPALSVRGDDEVSSNADYGTQRSRRLGRFRSHTSMSQMPLSTHAPPAEDEYSSDVIDLLDLVDPEVRTLGTLTNLQNSLFVPNLGSLVNRQPTYELTRNDSRPGSAAIEKIGRSRAGTRASRMGPPPSLPPIQQGSTPLDVPQIELQDQAGRRVSISSELSDSHYAVPAK